MFNPGDTAFKHEWFNKVYVGKRADVLICDDVEVPVRTMTGIRDFIKKETTVPMPDPTKATRCHLCFAPRTGYDSVEKRIDEDSHQIKTTAHFECGTEVTRETVNRYHKDDDCWVTEYDQATATKGEDCI